MININNTSKTFNKRKSNKQTVLENISVNLPDKGLIAIVGKSGSGKTTLLNILGGLDNADKGDIQIDNESFFKKKDEIRNRKIGYIFQNFYLEDGYTIEQILTNQMHLSNNYNYKLIDSQIDYMLKLVGLENYRKRTPSSLSGGQKQRVAIARALMKNPSIILADEPTGNLDDKTSHTIMQILENISRSKLVILVSHEEDLVSTYADKIISLADGKIVDFNDNDKKGTLNAEDFEFNNQISEQNSKKNGKLFNLKNSYRRDNFTFNFSFLTKQIFLVALAVVLVLFVSRIYKALSHNSYNQSYINNNLYYETNNFDNIMLNNDLDYNNVEIFTSLKSTDYISFASLDKINNIEISFIGKSFDKNLKLKHNQKLQPGEIIISSSLAKKIMSKSQIKNMSLSKFIHLVLLQNKYKIINIIETNDDFIYFEPIDFYNYYQIYDYIKFQDETKLFFNNKNNISSFKAGLNRTDDKNLKDDEAIILINRNSAYKMIKDTTELDVIIEQTNFALQISPKSIQINGSNLFVKNIQIVKNQKLNSDLILVVNNRIADNPLKFLKPNPSNLMYYLSFSFTDDNQKNTFKTKLESKSVYDADIQKIQTNALKTEQSLQVKNSLFFLSILALLIVIYYYIEKTDNIKINRNIAVFRAIGVNKSNLFFVKTINILVNNMICFSVSFLMVALFFIVRFAIDGNIGGGLFGYFALSYFGLIILLTFISLLPQFKILFKTPAELLNNYDM